MLLIARPFGRDLAAISLEDVAFNIIGSFCVGASFVYAKKYVIPPNIPAAALTTYQLALSLIILALIIDPDGIGNIRSDAWVATGLAIGLGVLGTGLAFIIYYYIIDKLGAVSASPVAYIPPFVAIIIGVFQVGEEIDACEYAGAALILAGVALVNRRPAAEA